MGQIFLGFNAYISRMSAPREKKVQDIVDAPVVSDDPTSQEAILARQAKTIEVQSAADSQYDTVIERFSSAIQPKINIPFTDLSIPLLVVGVIASLVFAPCILLLPSAKRSR